MSLSNFEIEDICEELKLSCIGVFSKDQIPKERKVGAYYINLQNHNDGNGTHWVFMRLFPNAKFIYFDSFGESPPEQIIEWSKPFKPIAINNRQIQDLKSEKCGWFCISLDYYFTYDCKTDKDVFDNYSDFLSIWSSNTKLNDKILKEFLGSKTLAMK